MLASYFEYCIRRDTEDGRGPWKGRINPASGNPLTEELRHGMIGRDLPARQRQRDGFRRRIPRILPKVLEPTAIQKLIDSAGSNRDKAILILLSRAGQRIGDWSPVAGQHGILGMELEDVDRKRRFITVRQNDTIRNYVVQAQKTWRKHKAAHCRTRPARFATPISIAICFEFMYAIPREQLVRPGQRRSLMRRALAGVVPDELDCGGKSLALYRRLNQGLTALFDIFHSIVLLEVINLQLASQDFE